MITYGILGPLEVRRDGFPLPISAPKQRSLLGLLLLRANTPISQHELIDALWQGEAPRTARAALQNYVHALRRVLGHEALDHTPSGYVIWAEPGCVDLYRFRAEVADAARATAAERAAKLRHALAIWQGAALAGLPAGAWRDQAARRLEEERLNALEERIEADLEVGEHGSLVAELEELVALHPVRERLWALLMIALYRSGRQAEAASAYQRAQDLFVETVGIEPGLVLKELQRAILVQDHSLDNPKRLLGSTLERAAAILPRGPRDRAQSLFDYGVALLRVGEARLATSTLQAAERLAQATGERSLVERARVLLAHLAVFVDGASMTQALVVAERATLVLGELGDDAGVSFTSRYHALLLRDVGRAGSALEVATHAAVLARRTGDREGEAAARSIAAQCAALGPTPVPAAIALCHETETLRDESHAVWAADALAWLLAQADRIDEARQLYRSELELLRRRGLGFYLGPGSARAALAERAAGDLPRAASLLRSADALTRAQDMRGELPAVAGELGCVLALLGEVDEAARLADEARVLCVEGDVLGETLWRRGLALVAARRGDAAQARRLSDEARVHAEASDWLTFRGETLEEAAFISRLAADRAREAEALQSALAAYTAKGNLPGAARVRTLLEAA